MYLNTVFWLAIISIEMYGNDTGSLADALFCTHTDFCFDSAKHEIYTEFPGSLAEVLLCTRAQFEGLVSLPLFSVGIIWVPFPKPSLCTRVQI